MSTELFGLTGKVAVITGSGRGLGKAMARGMATAGARVVTASRTAADAEGMSLVQGKWNREDLILLEVEPGNIFQ